MLASHAVMQAFNSKFRGRDFVMERSEGELKRQNMMRRLSGVCLQHLQTYTYYAYIHVNFLEQPYPMHSNRAYV